MKKFPLYSLRGAKNLTRRETCQRSNRVTNFHFSFSYHAFVLYSSRLVHTLSKLLIVSIHFLWTMSHFEFPNLDVDNLCGAVLKIRITISCMCFDDLTYLVGGFYMWLVSIVYLRSIRVRIFLLASGIYDLWSGDSDWIVWTNFILHQLASLNYSTSIFLWVSELDL